jgi:hypothetical protein
MAGTGGAGGSLFAVVGFAAIGVGPAEKREKRIS